MQEDLQGGGTFDASGAFRDERWPDGTAAGGSASADSLDSSGDGKKRRAPPTAVTNSNKKVDSADQQQQSSDKDNGLNEVKKPLASPPKSETKSSTEVVTPVAPPIQEPAPAKPVEVDDGLELHAQAVVSTLVAQLVDQDEDQPPPPNAQGSPSPPGLDQWFYRYKKILRITKILVLD